MSKRGDREFILDKKWIELYCKGDWKSCIRYQMEEKGIGRLKTVLIYHN